MANLRREPTSYQPFRSRPLMADGLLAVQREGGELLDKVSAGLFRIADAAGAKADEETARRNARAAEQAVLAGRPQIDVEGGDAIGGNGTPRGGGYSGDVNGAIEVAANRYGVDPSTLRTIAQIESGGNPRAKNPRSSAGGLFQFIDSTARQYGLVDRFDPGQAADAAARLTRDNAAYLSRVLGRAPTPGELYLAHQQGAGGAAKLLANPDAKASSVVGADAVRLNGGQPGMSAGQFANLWIKKAERGYVLPAAADNLDPVATGSTGEAPAFRMSGGRWRPSGQDTIAGRAWDEAGSRAYLALLRNETVSTLSQVYDKYGEDPATLGGALATLKGEMLRDHVFPEVQLDFEVAYDGLANGYMEKSRSALKAKQREQAAADNFERTEKIKTDIYRQSEQFDASDPASADILQAGLSALDANYDQAVDQGILSPKTAAVQKAKDRRDVATRFYLGQAASLSPDEVATLRGKMGADFAAGGLDGIDGDGWESLDAKLMALEKRKREDAASAATKLKKAGDALADRAKLGYEINPNDLTALVAAAGGAENGEQLLEDTARKIDAAEAIRTLPTGEAETYVSKLREDIGKKPTDAQIDLIDYAEKALAGRKKAIETDPLGQADREGVIGLQPIDATSDDTLAASLGQRREQAQRTAAQYGSPVPSIFRPEEVKTMKADIASLDGKRFTEAMKKLDFIASGGGFADVAAQFGNDAVERLQDWQGRLRYGTPEEVTAWLRDRADPKWNERVKPLVTKGETEARKYDFDDVVADLDDNAWWDVNSPIDSDTKRMLMTDFTLLMGQRYAVVGNAGTAREQALEQMRRVWGTTSVDGTRGGRLMPYPPEKFYPDVGAKKDWLGEEWAEFAQSRGVDVANLSLVPDGKTKAAVDRQQAPGYLISVIDPETGMDNLMMGADGRPVRYFFDPIAAQKKAMARAETARRSQHDPWITINENTTIGPFYPPWRPATEPDMRMREQRIREIMSERQKRHEEHRRIREQLRTRGIPGEQ